MFAQSQRATLWIKKVLGAGLEPACLSAYAPQTYVSAIPPPELIASERENFPQTGAPRKFPLLFLFTLLLACRANNGRVGALRRPDAASTVRTDANEIRMICD